MAQKLSVQIALEGGEELKRQLAAIGKEGTKAFNDIKKAAQQAGGFEKLDPGTVVAKLEKAGITGAAAINKIQDAVRSATRLESVVQGVKQLEDSFGALGKVIGPLGGEFRKVQQAGTALYRVLGPIGVAGGAAFLAIGVAATVAIQQTLAFAESVSKVSAEAIKLGLTITEFDKMRLGLEGLGASADAISQGIAKLKGELDALNVDKLVEAAKGIRGDAFRGTAIGGIPTGELQKLKDVALGVGKAADLARAALVKLGIVNFDPVAESFKKLGIAAGEPQERLPEIFRALQQLPDGATRTALAFNLLGEKLGTLIIQILRAGGSFDQFKQKMAGGVISPEQEAAANRLQQALNRLNAAWDRFGSLHISPALTTGIDAVTAAVGVLSRTLTTLDWSVIGLGARLVFNPFITVVQLGIATISQFTSALASIVWDAISGAGVAAWSALISAVDRSIAQVANFVSSLGSITWDFISNLGVNAWNALTAAIQRAIDKMLQFIGLKPQGAPATGGGGAPLPHASGGFIGGRGTGTSDSNLAWLSRGEYVTPARAVRQPGVLAFLEALRRSGGNLSRVLDGMGRFAMGGMVAPQLGGIPAFAKGGLNGGGGSSRVLNLTIGAETFRGLSVPEHTAQSLERFAVHSQIASTGRKPSWKR